MYRVSWIIHIFFLYDARGSRLLSIVLAVIEGRERS